MMEEDDIIVSGQSCSHRSHAALTRSLPDRCTVFACTLVQLSVSLSVSQSTLMSPYLFIYIYVYGYIYIQDHYIYRYGIITISSIINIYIDIDIDNIYILYMECKYIHINNISGAII